MIEDLTDEQLERYARHLVLPEIGEEGQEALLAAKVLVIGAGGLGSPLLLYLAAAGVGTLGVVDDDSVDLSNLQRQVLHNTDAVGTHKVDSALARLKQINPEVETRAHKGRLTADNVMEVLGDYDLVCDGSDNFATRYLVNDACYLAGKTLVSAAIMRFDGQLSTFKAHTRDDGEEAHPCYRCLFGEQPPRDPKQSCADVGVLASLPGVMGSLQATEVIKEITGAGESLSGRLLLYDALSTSFRVIKAKPDPACPLCGSQPTIKEIEAENYRPEEAVCAS
ncbi:MAG: molybdopterin-synthase adenylyltransferase MoeB [Limibacillus sp.]|jgi:molybdopterin/thiamine biosynthesis adenylyltransferase